MASQGGPDSSARRLGSPEDFDVLAREFRSLQRMLPAVDTLYTLLRTVVENRCDAHASVLVMGAGGGREIEALGQSPWNFRFVAVDTSAKMLEITKSYADHVGCTENTLFVHGPVMEAPNDRHDAATSMLVMHFLQVPQKRQYLQAIRQRLKPGAVFVLCDTCIEDDEEYVRMLPLWRHHARLAGVPESKLAAAQRSLALGYAEKLTLISEATTKALLRESGFDNVHPFFRSLWYCGWYCTAV